MDPKDVLTLVIALWGAILSTFLAAREFRRERRRIRIFFEHIYWEERFQLKLVNVGHRPVTVTSIAMKMFHDENGKRQAQGEPVYSTEFSPIPEKEFPLPAVLSDGQHVDIPVSDYVGMAAKYGRIELSIYDAEGNVYKDFKIRDVDVKWGTYNYPQTRK